MKKLVIILAILSLTGCAPPGDVKQAVNSYMVDTCEGKVHSTKYTYIITTSPSKWKFHYVCFTDKGGQERSVTMLDVPAKYWK